MSTPGRHRRRISVALAAIAAASLAAAVPASADAAGTTTGDKLVDVQLLAFNDFHGQLEALDPTKTSSGRIGSTPAGGAEYLATQLANLRAGHPRSLTVAAGDLIGASPLLSAAFHDEPSIEALNEMHLDVSSVGNHEFDEGAAEVLRMADGGCLDDGDGLNNQNSCPIAGHEFAGADFDYLAANVVDDATGDTLLPGVSIKELDGVKIGFIGMTLEGTPSIVTPAGVAGLSFKDEVATANKLVPSLVRQGVRSIVVLLHEGGFPSGGYNECPGISGPIVDIAANLSPQIDAVITGHTHQAYNCTLPDPDGQPRLVTSASSLGRIITDINLKINTRSHDVVRSSSSAVNRIVTRDVAKDPEITSLMNQYGAIIAPIANAVVGSTAEPITRPNAPQTPMGQVIADAQLAATRAAEDGGAQLALMNPGGVRAELDAGDVTYGEAFAVQPFANALTTVTLTGAQLKAVLEQQRSNLILQPSTGFRFTFTASAPAGARVSDITLGGAPIDPAASYRVTANNFLTTGGDGFTAFLAGTDIKNGVIDLDALTKYIHDNSPLHVPADFPRVTIG